MIRKIESDSFFDSTRARPGFSPAIAVMLMLFCAFGVVLTTPSFSADAQALPEEEFVVVRAGTIITGTGNVIEDGTIVIVDGKVRLVGKQLEYPTDATVIDARDQVVMPGLVAVRGRANLPNFRRSGNKSHLSVGDEIISEELDLTPYLEHGFTAVCLNPSGTNVPGMSTVYRTGGETSNRILSEEPYLLATFGNPGRDKAIIRGAFRQAKGEIEKVEKARAEWEKKQAEAKKKAEEEKKQEKKGASAAAQDDKPKNGEKNGKSEAAEFKPPAIAAPARRFVDLLQEEAGYPMLFTIGGASDYLHARDAMSEYEQVDQRYLLGSGFQSAYHHIVDDLAEDERFIIIEPRLTNLPYTATRYNLAGELAARGIAFAFVPTGDGAGSFRDYFADVASLVRSGLPRETALSAMTHEAARMVGLSERLGSIAKDRDADIIFLNGDPFAPGTEVTRVMILGETVYEAGEK